MTALARYLDASTVLRATVDTVADRADSKARIAAAAVLVTSRLALVEVARAFLRARLFARSSHAVLDEAEREAREILDRCAIWDLTVEICESARTVSPQKPLRALDALHLATFLAARKNLPGLELLTTDHRLRDAAAACV